MHLCLFFLSLHVTFTAGHSVLQDCVLGAQELHVAAAVEAAESSGNTLQNVTLEALEGEEDVEGKNWLTRSLLITSHLAVFVR